MTPEEVYESLKRADVLTGVGQFGLVLLGLDDGSQLEDNRDQDDDRQVSDE